MLFPHPPNACTGFEGPASPAAAERGEEDDDDDDDDDDENDDGDVDSDGGVAEFSSSLGQRQRSHIIRRARAGAVRVIVCSDGMARGMDLDGVGLVVNYDVPSQPKTYVHRCGQGGRRSDALRLVEAGSFFLNHGPTQDSADGRGSKQKLVHTLMFPNVQFILERGRAMCCTREGGLSVLGRVRGHNGDRAKMATERRVEGRTPKSMLRHQNQGGPYSTSRVSRHGGDDHQEGAGEAVPQDAQERRWEAGAVRFFPRRPVAPPAVGRAIPALPQGPEGGAGGRADGGAGPECACYCHGELVA